MKFLHILAESKLFQIVYLLLFVTSLQNIMSGQTVKQNNLTELNPDQIVKRELVGGETHKYNVEAKSNEFINVEIEQKDVEIIVSLFAPDGKTLVEMDGKNGFLWRESISAVAETGGFFRVEIKAYATADTVGSYTIKLLKPRLSAAQDRQHIEAERRLAAGRKLYEQDGAHYEEAIGEFETLVKLWRDLKDPQYEGMALVNLGWIYYMFSNYEKTLASLNRAVELLRETKDKLGESKALNIILTTKLS